MNAHEMVELITSTEMRLTTEIAEVVERHINRVSENTGLRFCGAELRFVDTSAIDRPHCALAGVKLGFDLPNDM